MWSVLNCLDILSEDKDAATSSTADSLLKNIFCFNFVLGIMVPNSVLISIVYLHLLSTAVPAAAAHLPRAQPEVGAGRGGDQPVRGGDTLGCRVSATMVAVWMLCEKYRFDLANLASVPTSLVVEVPYPSPGGGGGPGAHRQHLPAAAPAAPVVRAAHCNDDNGNSVLVLA